MPAQVKLEIEAATPDAVADLLAQLTNRDLVLTIVQTSQESFMATLEDVKTSVSALVAGAQADRTRAEEVAGLVRQLVAQRDALPPELQTIADQLDTALTAQQESAALDDATLAAFATAVPEIVDTTPGGEVLPDDALPEVAPVDEVPVDTTTPEPASELGGGGFDETTLR